MSKDLTKADANDEALTIDEMLHNSANWDFAEALLKSGQVPADRMADLAEKFPAFWLTHMAKAAGANEHDRSVN